MPTTGVIQLRQLLKEKLPQLRLGFQSLEQRKNHWPTGLSRIDTSLEGGLPRGVLTEIVAGQPGSGSALLMTSLLQKAARENQVIALIDGGDSFDVTAVDELILSRLLWVRCRSANEALKAADLLLRDRNVPLVFLDFVANPAAQLRRIQSTIWFRFQRILEQTSTVCVVLTPLAMVGPAQVRMTLKPAAFSLDMLEREREDLLGRLQFELIDTRRFRAAGEPLRRTA
jgi:hypothetical protein